jgi:hypothetical protein
MILLFKLRLPRHGYASGMRAFTIVPILVLTSLSPAEAGQVVLVSKEPYWAVGVRDDALSRACSLDQFGPVHPGDLVARFIGSEGSALLDVAKGNGVNLRDPKHLAKAREDYFFRNVGTTDCEVLVGGRTSTKTAAKPPR